MEIHEDIGSWEQTFYLFMLSCHFHFTLYYDTCMSTLFGHVYLFYVLTMEVFTTSWWVVNQSIVAIVFIYASTGFRSHYPTFGGVELLFYILLTILYPTFGWVTPFDSYCYYCIYCFLIAGLSSRVCLWLFGGLVFADTRRHKRIGHAEILNF